MRKRITLTLYLSLTGLSFLQEVRGQEVRQPAPAELTPRQQIARYLQAGDYTAAEKALREILTAHNAEPAKSVDLRSALADLLREEGRETEARELFRGVLKTPGITWKQRLAATVGLAGMESHATSTDDAVREWTTALAISRDHGDAVAEAGALRGLAITWFEAGDPSRAQPLLRRSLQLLENSEGAPAWELAATLATTGHVYQALDKPALAESAWTRARDLYRETFGEAHPQTAYIMERLAELYAARKDFELARQYAGRALKVMREACGEDSLAVAAALGAKGRVEEYAGAFPAALEAYGAALKIARRHPDNRLIEQGVIRHYVALLKATHRDREAKALVAETRLPGQQSLR